MKVNGTMNVEVDISFDEALKVVLSELGYHSRSDLTVLEPNDKNNETGVRALYSYEDISYHGSPCLKYTLVTTDETRINDYLLALELVKVRKRRCK